jgi:predicted GIY-YIG superfamily endonuclease
VPRTILVTKNMSYIYVLQSPDGSDIYIGFSNNLKRRMAEHERSAHPGWRLVYYEAYESESDARRRERRLKDHGNAVRQLKQRIKDSWNKS